MEARRKRTFHLAADSKLTSVEVNRSGPIFQVGVSIRFFT